MKKAVVGATTHTYLSMCDNNYLVCHLIILRTINGSIYSINKEADYSFLKAHKMLTVF